MKQAPRTPFALLILFAACFSGAPLSASDDDMSDQTTLSEIVRGNAEELAAIERTLNLAPLLDVGAAFDSKTLEAQTKALVPMVAFKRTALPTASSSTAQLTKEPKAYVASATIWSKDNSSAFMSLAGRLTINVCWVNPEATNLRGRELTRAAVAATWEHYGNLSLVGWGKCESDARGIKIQVSDARPWSKIGKLGDRHSPSMLLNFEFETPAMAGCKTKKDLCIHSIAVHEFGHALGFLHEQDSPETPRWCKRQLADGSITKPMEALQAKIATDWDEFSVMDYCFDIYSRRIQLSDCDVAALFQIYQKPSEVAYQPKCVVRMNP